MRKIKNIKGQKFTKLKVIDLQGVQNHRAMWLCKCDCGNEIVVSSNSLLTKKTKSCGCLNIKKIIERNTTHGLSKTRLYKIWCGMKQRCYNKNDKRYNRYGKRDIKICDEWLKDFKKFYDWSIKNGYSDKLTIDRINNNGNYEPNNCRWITQHEQTRNYSRNIFLTYNGETLCLKDMAKKYNIPEYKLSRGLKKGYNIEEIFKMNK